MVNNEKAGVLSLLIAVSGAAHAADITLNFSGNVTVTGCDISASSKTKAIAFGTVDLAKAAAGGTGSSALKRCGFFFRFYQLCEP
ncbi:type 1 fimbrial protein [Providencia rettgeri]|uniref:Type 1 fimbrial protein n=1 Tax=Providencia rettgeri TaxID=587 RepID=A0A939SP64_PRORE|nr:type 1 fimbrial protein [Providencia rettgeri]